MLTSSLVFPFDNIFIYITILLPGLLAQSPAKSLKFGFQNPHRIFMNLYTPYLFYNIKEHPLIHPAVKKSKIFDIILIVA